MFLFRRSWNFRARRRTQSAVGQTWPELKSLFWLQPFPDPQIIHLFHCLLFLVVSHTRPEYYWPLQEKKVKLNCIFPIQSHASSSSPEYLQDESTRDFIPQISRARREKRNYVSRVELRAVSLLLENPRGKGCRARVTREQRSRERVTRARLLFPRGFSSKRETARSLVSSKRVCLFLSHHQVQAKNLAM